MYEAGDGVEKNLDEAARWFFKANEQEYKINLASNRYESVIKKGATPPTDLEVVHLIHGEMSTHQAVTEGVSNAVISPEILLAVIMSVIWLVVRQRLIAIIFRVKNSIEWGNTFFLKPDFSYRFNVSST